MKDNLTIVLDDPRVLTELCGPNDSNLRVIENLMETKVLSRGNEIYLDSNDGEKRDLFTGLIEQLKDHLSFGQRPVPELIRAVFDSLKTGDTDRVELLREQQIVIPRSTKVFPRTHKQALYIKGMNTFDLAFSIGPAGTGKTYLAIAHALREILNRTRNKLILTRPVVEAGESLGYLPGDLSQKISPYLRPLYDAMDALVPLDVITRLEENHIIEIAPLAYMRGRSLTNCYVILDEAQNTTREQMKMFLTRIGEGTKAVVTGDVTQIDLPSKQNSGLLHAMKILSGIREIHFSQFTAEDVVRSPLVKKIIQAYEENEQQS